MPVKAKYIKDLPLKRVLDGSESLLVQDLNGTQQAPLGTIVDEIKQNSQEKIREIESGLNQTNTQLSIESKRIDGFVALGEGSTTGDAELIDGRIDSSGVVHPNIGGCIRSEGNKINGILGVSIKYGDNAIDDSEFKDKVFNEGFVNKFNNNNTLFFTVHPAFAIDNNTQLTTQLYFTDGSVIEGNSSNIVEYYNGEKKLTYYGLGGVTQSAYPVTGVTKIKIILAGDNSEYYGRTVQGISMKLTKVTGYAEFKKEYVSSFKEEVINLVKNESCDKVNDIFGIYIKYGDNAIDDSEFKDKVFNEDFVNKFSNNNSLFFTVHPAFAIDNNTQLTTQLYFTDGSVITGNSSNIVEYYKGEEKLTYYGLGGITQSNYPVTGVTKIKIILGGDNSSYYGKIVKGICMKLTNKSNYVEFKKEYISSFKEEVEEVIDLVKNEPTSKLPDYYTDYLTAKVDELKNIEESVGENGDSFVFITDYHAPSNQGHSPKLINEICNQININNVIFGGDILTEVYDGTSTEQLRDFMKLFKDQQRFRVIVGNHDPNPYGGEGNKVSDSQLYPILVKRNEIDCNTNKKLYYSYDNVSQKIRYIFLNSSDTFTLDAEQETFLTEQITSVTNEWTIIIFVHAFYRFIAIDDRTCSKTFACGTKILNIVDNTNDGGKVACVFTGDSHIDQAKQYDKGYWVIGVTCDANGGQASSASTDNRQTGTVNEQAFDVVFVDTKNKKIICKRVGGGIGDREFIYN